MPPVTPPPGTQCSATREWFRRDGLAVLVGLQPDAWAHAGGLSAVDLRPAGSVVAAGDSLGLIETAKTTFDLYAPVDGRVAAVQDTLPPSPPDPWAHWFVRLDSAPSPEAPACP